MNFRSYLIIENEGEIIQISSSCIETLNLDNQKLEKQNPHIEHYIEDFFDRMAEFQERNGGQTTVQVHKKKKFITYEAMVHVKPVIFRKQGQ